MPGRFSLVLFLIVAGLLAQAGSTSAASGVGVELESYFRVLWGLGVVLAIILILYALLRKRFSLFSNQPEKNITIVEIKPLMGKKSLCLVRVKGQEYLLGLSGDRISHLATLPNTPSFADSLAAVGKESQS